MDLEKEHPGLNATPDSDQIGAEDIAFYYEEMLRSNLVELEVTTPKRKVLLKRSYLEKEFLPAGPAVTAGFPFKKRADHSHEKTETAPSTAKTIPSPINGIFYRAASPQSQPFVKEGQIVEQGSTLCIVEAMKVMNEIKAELRCKILKILVENGKPVSNKQALFSVEPL
jgi:acetyl-CoA carboxylase biotin carboxyl carrier protein